MEEAKNTLRSMGNPICVAGDLITELHHRATSGKKIPREQLISIANELKRELGRIQWIKDSALEELKRETQGV